MEEESFAQTVAALIEELQKCDQEKLVLVRAMVLRREMSLEVTEVEETDENVYLVAFGDV